MFLKDTRYISEHALYHVPNFIKNEYPLFVKLLEYYYEFMNREGNVLYGLENIRNHNHTGSPYNQFWEEIYANAGFPFSDLLMIDKRQFWNYLMDFYMARGSIQSIRFMIKALYGVDAKVSNPRDEMLIPSQAEYIDNQFVCVKLRDIPVNIFNNLMDRMKKFELSVKSNSSDEVLDIENIYIQLKDGHVFLNLKVNHKGKNKFVAGEQLDVFSRDGFSVTGINCPAIRFSVLEAGNGYKKGDRIKISDNVINQGTVYVKSLTKGGVKELEIVSGGMGYEVGDYLYAAKNIFQSGYGFHAYVSEVDGSGAITAIEIASGGEDFESVPLISVFSKNGTEAVIRVSKHNIAGIKEVEYRENFNIDLTRFKVDDINFTFESENGADAKLDIDFSAIGYTSSFHRTTEGFLNSNSFLTDSLYYQQFSYKINSTLPRYRYDRLMDELLHPSGYIRYAGFTIYDGKKRINLIKKGKFIKD